MLKMDKMNLQEDTVHIYKVPIYLTLTNNELEQRLAIKNNSFAHIICNYDEKEIGFLSIYTKVQVMTNEGMAALIKSAKALQYFPFINKVTAQYKKLYPELKSFTFRYRLGYQAEYLGEGNNMVYRGIYNA